MVLVRSLIIIIDLDALCVILPILVIRLGQMTNAKKGTETTIVPKDRIDSPSFDEGSSSGGSANGGAPVLKKGPWTSAEDAILIDYVKKHGEGNWNAVQKNSGLSRCGKSCRLRWANHLRPNLKKGAITQEEEDKIIQLHAMLGNKWAKMAARVSKYFVLCTATLYNTVMPYDSPFCNRYRSFKNVLLPNLSLCLI